MKSKTFLRQLSGMIVIMLLIFVSGCGTDGMNPTSGSFGTSENNLSLSAMSDPSMTDDNQIIITEAKALIGEVELETEPSSVSVHLSLSPFVVNLNSISAAQLVAAANVQKNNYNKIKFQIHKPEDNEPIPDPEFREGESGNKRYSIIVKGTFNGIPFVYKSRKSANVVLFFSNVIALGETARNITLLINPSSWFKNGNDFVNPNDPSNENLIDENIRNSFKRAFKDDNRDGVPD